MLGISSCTFSFVDIVNPRPSGVPDRAVVHVGPKWTVKRYRTQDEALVEAAWFERVPWAAPELVCLDDTDLVIATLPVAANIPGWRPANELRWLLERLRNQGLHHRDVHTKNIVMGEDGMPLLIDWETAIEWESEYGYDLHGPEVSGVPIPELHTRYGLDAQWWGSPQEYAIGYEWKVEAPCP